tara:strand:+ start:1046 stop:1576 length:531 start_codon:yes stop_codon:yes gene_type:complete
MSENKFYSATGNYILKQNDDTLPKRKSNTKDVDFEYKVDGKLFIEVDETEDPGDIKPSKPEDDDELYRFKKIEDNVSAMIKFTINEINLNELCIGDKKNLISGIKNVISKLFSLELQNIKVYLKQGSVKCSCLLVEVSKNNLNKVSSIMLTDALTKNLQYLISELTTKILDDDEDE